uniref:2-hydroxyacylsphingosine 1-beta-galactosyltransferase-like n=1 Tax=Saccoglossus kowalevskii TaxID=10224 RepID=A0ABM0LUR8_SACKO|nr:PREDICTED: 2-hydroxyacylsphingosine 1-beta-galactosyltransferase-like [Saccoglossus kowalevskii]
MNSENGVAIVAMGTWYAKLTGDYLGKLPHILSGALARLPLKVIWRLSGRIPSNIGNNTEVMKWLPQNDLLGHSKTVVFINHAGTNGIYEAIYHGVPMVNIPLGADHFDNAAKVQKKGMGKTVFYSDITEESLYQTIMEVVNNNT